jgi:predicted nucleic acid-binding protein
MPFVVDASVVASWAFPDEDSDVARKAFERVRADEAWAPALWWFELRNTLLVGERRRRISEADVGAFLRQVSRLSIFMNHEPVEADVMRLARGHRLTVYDAAYLELAMRMGSLVATLDRPLLAACEAEGLALI